MAISCVATSILVTKECQYFPLRRVYSSRRNGNILRCDEYTRHEGMAISCVTTSILATKEWQYFPLRRVYSSRRNGNMLRCDEHTRHEGMAIFSVTTSILDFLKTRRKGMQISETRV